MKAIPKGQTRTYKQVAVLCGRPHAYRAVGNILARSKGTWALQITYCFAKVICVCGLAF